MNIVLKNEIIELANLVSKKAQLYIVGGFVRDLLLNKNPSDVDLTSKLTIKELEDVLKDSKFSIKIKNEKLGTATITYKENCYEYTTFRKDYYSENGCHFPNKVEFVKTLEEDMLRRDFTINAVYLNILTRQITGIENGKNDVKKRILRQVNPTTLNYDGERILRMINYAVKYNLKIEKETMTCAQKNYKNVYKLNKNMLKLYEEYFNKLSFFKKLKTRFLLKKLNLNKIFNTI